jgi:hypothetical protein
MQAFVEKKFAAGHLIQRERAAAVNDSLLAFVRSL